MKSQVSPEKMKELADMRKSLNISMRSVARVLGVAVQTAYGKLSGWLPLYAYEAEILYDYFDRARLRLEAGDTNELGFPPRDVCTPEEVNELKTARISCGVKVQEIAAALHRSVSTVYAKLNGFISLYKDEAERIRFILKEASE